MASAVDICNLALGHLGQDANVSSISPPEGSTEAELCARFYPIARDALLELREWDFASKRGSLALVDNTSRSEWAYAYKVPSDYIQAIYLRGADNTDPDAQEEYIIEDGVLYTNAVDPILQYKHRQTDTTRYSPLFVNALSWLLASYLAGPVTKSMDLKDAAYKMFVAAMAQAAASAYASRNYTPDHNPEWVSDR